MNLKTLELKVIGMFISVGVFVFVLMPFISFLRQKEFNKFYELEGTYTIETIRNYRSHSILYLQNGDDYNFISPEFGEIKKVISQGDTITKRAKNSSFSIRTIDNEKYVFNYTQPLQNYSYWSLIKQWLPASI